MNEVRSSDVSMKVRLHADPFVDQLASLCRVHVTRSKWVFVPSHAIGRTLGERIALGGTNWLNLRFVTPLDIALRMGAPFLVERGIDPSEEGLGPALIMRLLLDLPRKHTMHGRSVSTVTAYTAHREWARRPNTRRSPRVRPTACVGTNTH